MALHDFDGVEGQCHVYREVPMGRLDLDHVSVSRHWGGAEII